MADFPVLPPVEVMLARPVDRLPAPNALPGGVQYEQKWDGYRTVAFNTHMIYLQSRRGADLTASFPEVATAVESLPDCVVDGELVVWGDGALDFPALLQRMGAGKSKARLLAAERPAHLVVFDLLAIGRRDLRGEPLRERRQCLEELLTGASRKAGAVRGDARPRPSERMGRHLCGGVPGY